MPDSVNWSFSASSKSTTGIGAAGALAVDAVTAASVSLDAAMGSAQDLDFQIDDTDNVDLLLIVSSLNDGTVEVKADGASAIAMTGPIILFGAGVKLFAGDLDTLSVQNKSPTDAAQIDVLIGRTL